MGSWRVAKSLLRLIDQVNLAYPNRSKASDGTIGDAAHQTRQSDHNPRVVPALGTVPVVLAADITHDPANGCDTYALATLLVISRDSRISYVISNRRITGPAHGWVWVAYTGTDPHTNHMHVSVVATLAADDVHDWQIGPDMTTYADDFARSLAAGLHALPNGDVCCPTLWEIARTEWQATVDVTLAAIKAGLPTTGVVGGLSDADRTLLTTLTESVDRLEATLARMAAAVPTPA